MEGATYLRFSFSDEEEQGSALPFQIERLLGSGAMGHVYAAVDVSLGRRVALKILQRTDEAAKARFLREGELLAALRHPGIVRIHGGGLTEGGQPFFVMEEIAGARTLDRRFLELELAERLELLLEVADAVAYAHARGIVHRDLKPENVLVGADGRARVCDFGLAWRGDLEALTRSGALLGTPSYMSPEQTGMRGRVEPSPASDVWSLGAMLYEVLTGEVPFSGGSLIELVTMINAQELRPPRDVNPRIPGPLAHVCERALEKDPARRYPDAGELARALRAARRVDPRGPLLRALLALAALVSLAALALSAASATPPAVASPAPTSSAAPRAPLLARARELRAARAPAPELYAQLERDLRAARDPEAEREVRRFLARVAFERAHFERVLAASEGSADPETRYLRARALCEQERIAQAEPLFEELSDAPEPWGLLARTTDQVLRGDRVAEALARLEAELPDHPQAILLVVDVGLELEPTRPARARAACERLGEALPRTAWALTRLARLGLNQGGDLEVARRHLDRVEALCAPELPHELHVGRAQIASREGDSARALRELRLATRAPPRKAATDVILGLTYLAHGRTVEAGEAWRAGAAANPEAFASRVSTWQPLPIRYRIRREVGGFAAPPTEAGEAWIRRTLASLRPESRVAASSLLERAIRGAPWRELEASVEGLGKRDDPRALLLAGLVAAGRDRAELARAIYERARVRSAPPEEIAYALADLRSREVGLRDAGPAFSAVVERWPTTPSGRAAQAALLLLSGDYDEARALASSLADLDPHPSVRLTLALSHLQAGDVLSAQRVAAEGSRHTGFVYAALPRLQAYCQGELLLSSPNTPPEEWERLFAFFETLLQAAPHDLPLTSAALYALLLDPSTRWFQFADSWLLEADAFARTQVPERRAKIEGEVRALRGLRAIRLGQREEEVLRHWRGLGEGVLDRRFRELFRQRYGHPPQLD